MMMLNLASKFALMMTFFCVLTPVTSVKWTVNDYSKREDYKEGGSHFVKSEGSWIIDGASFSIASRNEHTIDSEGHDVEVKVWGIKYGEHENEMVYLGSENTDIIVKGDIFTWIGKDDPVFMPFFATPSHSAENYYALVGEQLIAKLSEDATVQSDFEEKYPNIHFNRIPFMKYDLDISQTKLLTLVNSNMHIMNQLIEKNETTPEDPLDVLTGLSELKPYTGDKLKEMLADVKKDIGKLMTDFGSISSETAGFMKQLKEEKATAVKNAIHTAEEKIESLMKEFETQDFNNKYEEYKVTAMEIGMKPYFQGPTNLLFLFIESKFRHARGEDFTSTRNDYSYNVFDDWMVGLCHSLTKEQLSELPFISELWETFDSIVAPIHAAISDSDAYCADSLNGIVDSNVRTMKYTVWSTIVRKTRKMNMYLYGKFSEYVTLTEALFKSEGINMVGKDGILEIDEMVKILINLGIVNRRIRDQNLYSEKLDWITVVPEAKSSKKKKQGKYLVLI